VETAEDAGGAGGLTQAPRRLKKGKVFMSFEAEVIPLFIGGILAVSVLELVVGLVFLRGRKAARTYLVGHVVSMAAGFFFLVRSVFANWLNFHPGSDSISNSVSFGLFGLLWALSVFFVVALVKDLARDT